jgi:hypothetical protein
MERGGRVGDGEGILETHVFDFDDKEPTSQFRFDLLVDKHLNLNLWSDRHLFEPFVPLSTLFFVSSRE